MQQGNLFAPSPAWKAATPRPAPSRAPFSRSEDRSRAWSAWVAGGKAWPPPEGLVSALISACMRGNRR